MTRDEIISGLKFTVEMFLLNPSTGEKYTEPRNDMDKTTIDACRGAIKLLEQEPWEDAVSRQAVLNTFDKRFESIPVGQTTEILLLRKDLRELPSVTPPGWVTVSERIPKPNETEHLIAKYYLVQNEYGDMMVARWDGKGWKQMYQSNSYLEDDVIAWMPLPSPYELQESEDD